MAVHFTRSRASAVELARDPLLPGPLPLLLLLLPLLLPAPLPWWGGASLLWPVGIGGMLAACWADSCFMAASAMAASTYTSAAGLEMRPSWPSNMIFRSVCIHDRNA